MQDDDINNNALTRKSVLYIERKNNYKK